MSMYRITEASAFSAVAAIVFSLSPVWGLVTIIAALVASAALEKFSAQAYRYALENDFMRRTSNTKNSAHFIKPECPRSWLVKRHIMANW